MLIRPFLTVANLSLAALPLMAAVLLLRALFKRRIPRRTVYLAWLLVLLRLLVPVSPSSPVSFYNLLPASAVSQQESGGTAVVLLPDTGDTVDFPVLAHPGAENPRTDGEPLAVPAAPAVVRRPIDRSLLLAIIWSCGAAGLLLFGVFSYLAVLRRVRRESVPLEKNVWLSELFETPVVCGVLRSRIVLPMSLDTGDGEQLRAVLSHECTHIRRRDNLWRLLATLTLYLHWFNPLVWVCYCAFIRDMEVSCDEAVLAAAGRDIRGEYAGSLLRLAAGQTNPLYGGVLSFGESGIKERVERIMNFKRAKLLLIVLCGAVLVALAAIFLTNPARTEPPVASDGRYTLSVKHGSAAFSAETGLELVATLTNNGDGDVWFARSYTLEYYDGSGWQAIRMGENGDGSIVRVAPGETEAVCDGLAPDAFYREPENGTYRLRQPLYADENARHQSSEAIAYFTVTTETVSDPAQQLAMLAPELLHSAGYRSVDGTEAGFTALDSAELARILSAFKAIDTEAEPKVYPDGDPDAAAPDYTLTLNLFTGLSYRIEAVHETALRISVSNTGARLSEYEVGKEAVDGFADVLAELAAAKPAQPEPPESQSAAPAASLYPYISPDTGDYLTSVYVLDAANYTYHLVEDQTLLDAIIKATRGDTAPGAGASGDGSVLLFGEWMDGIRSEYRFDSKKNTGLASLCAAAVKDTPAHAQWLVSMNPQNLTAATFTGNYNGQDAGVVAITPDALESIAAYLKGAAVQTPPKIYPQGNNPDTPGTLYTLQLDFSTGVSYHIFGYETGLCISSSDMGTLSLAYATDKAAVDGLRALMYALKQKQGVVVSAGLLPAEDSIATLYSNADKAFQFYEDDTLLPALRTMTPIAASALGKPLSAVDTLEFARASDGKKYTLHLYENGFTLDGSAVEGLELSPAYTLSSPSEWKALTEKLQTAYAGYESYGPYWLGLIQPGRVKSVDVTGSGGNQIAFTPESRRFEDVIRALKYIRVDTPAVTTVAAAAVPAEPHATITVEFLTGTVYTVTATEKNVAIVSSDMNYGLRYPLTESSGDALDYFNDMSAGTVGNPETAKPVIYLYPEAPTDVAVQLDFNGTLTYTYPAYHGGWNVTAQPDGTLTNHADGSTHYYLFWEGTADTVWPRERGFVVKGGETEAFLRKALPALGLLPREYNDFITYWVPKMQGNAWNLISFSGAEYAETAKLTVSPQPDSVLRVHMVWRALDAPIEIAPQTLAPFERRGFTLVEWGGTEVFD